MTLRPDRHHMRFGLTWGLLTISVLLLGVLAFLLWLAYRSELLDRGEQVISDTLWVRQSIEFQLGRHSETLRGLSQARAGGRLSADEFASKASVLLANNREIVRIALIDAAGKEIVAENSRGIRGGPAETALAAQVIQGRQERYGEVIATEKPLLLRFAVPVLGQEPNSENNSMIMTYSLESLLNEIVPWWLARENEVTLANAFGEPLIVHPAAAPARGYFRHQTPIALPGAGLMLMTDSVQDKPRVLPHAMSAAVAVLTITLILSLVLLWRDMRRRVEVEHRLSEQLTFRKAMENSLVTGLRARDMTGRVTYVNPAFCEMVGYSAEELLGRSWPMPFYDMDNHDESLRQRFKELLDGTITPHGHETEFIHKDGHRMSVLIHEAPLVDTEGKQTGWMSSILDITERKRVEDLNRHQQEKLQSTARLVTMGEVATTLSHELNQPLSAITSYAAGGLNLVNKNDDGLYEALIKIQQQAERAGHIIRSVHDFVRRREPHKAPCQIADVVNATLPLIDLQARKWNIQVLTDVAEHLPSIEVDPMMLEQVLLNLTRNAIEAMATQPPQRRKLMVSAISNGQGVELAVIDHGVGIADEQADKLFTPFFTTKPEGMGMGLNICRTAIEFHRGRLWFEPTPGGGATFKFTLQT